MGDMANVALFHSEVMRSSRNEPVSGTAGDSQTARSAAPTASSSGERPGSSETDRARSARAALEKTALALK